MATLPTTGLETHPVGTTNLAGIQDANWNRLEAIFNPLTGAGTLFSIIVKALIRSATLPTVDSTLVWDVAAGKPAFRPAWAALTYSGTPALDLLAASSQGLNLAGDAVFSFSNHAAGRRIELLVVADASTRALTWPVGARWLGTPLTSLPASKAARVRILATGTTDADCFMEAIVEP